MSEPREIQPEVLPTLLVDVTPNVFDIEGDTLLPYFLRLREERRKKRAKQVESQRKRGELTHTDATVSFTGNA